MRLTKYELDMIKKAFKETFKDGKTYLFGNKDFDIIIPYWKESLKKC